jgi:5S rRNA maturation endonuclease (ribonuclease M5)
MPGPDISAIVLCEGRDDKQVLECLLTDMEINHVGVLKYSGKDKLREALKLLRKSPEFTRGEYKRILVTRDADEDWDSAWTSMRDTIQQVFSIQLNDANEWVSLNEDSEIAAWVFPGRGRGGMIETLCLDVARQMNPEAFECLDQYADCLQQKHQATLHEKARFEIWSIAAQTFDAPRRRISMDLVIKRLPFDWKHEKFSEIREVLKTLIS